MYLKGLVMVYPNFQFQQSFSTNYVEPGEHTGRNGESESPSIAKLLPKGRTAYTVPLKKDNKFLRGVNLKNLDIIDVFHEKTSEQILFERGIYRNEEIVFRKFFISSFGNCFISSGSFIAKDDEREKFIVYQPQFGYSNQFSALRSALAMGVILNRTVVIPPLVLPDGRFTDYESVFLGTKITGTASLKTIAYRKFLDLHLRPSFIINFEGLSKFSAMSNDFFDFIGWNKTQHLNLPSFNRSESDMIRNFGGCRDEKVLAFVSLYTAIDFSSNCDINKSIAVFMKSFLRLNNRFEALYDNAYEKIHKPFTCIHIRRGDFREYCAMLHEESMKSERRPWLSGFRYDDCYQGKERIIELINNTKTKRNISNLYISTNDPVLVKEMRNIVRKDISLYDSSIFGTDPGNLPFLEQRLCIDAEYFIGNYYSTFTKFIIDQRIGESEYIRFK